MSATNNLQSLVNAKAALDLGLLTAEDYQRVKESFLKAQQLRSAIDAGLITEGPQVEQARGGFVDIVLRGEGSTAVPAAPPRAPPLPTAQAAASRAAPAPPGATTSATSGATTRPSGATRATRAPTQGDDEQIHESREGSQRHGWRLVDVGDISF